MAIPDLATGARTTFQASIWAGIPIKHHYKVWPWKGIKPIVEDTPVTVERVVAYRHFDLQQNYPETLTYLLFGAGDEAHLLPLPDARAGLRRGRDARARPEVAAVSPCSRPGFTSTSRPFEGNAGLTARHRCSNQDWKVHYSGQTAERRIR